MQMQGVTTKNTHNHTHTTYATTTAVYTGVKFTGVEKLTPPPSPLQAALNSNTKIKLVPPYCSEEQKGLIIFTFHPAK